MDSFELNKIIGALLGVVFVVFSVSLISEAIFSTPAPETPGYAIVVPEDGGEAAGEAEASPESVLPLLASADPSAGENIFKRCQACHTVDQGGPNKVGPNLWGIVDHPIASHEGFSYSGALQEFSQGGSVHWTYENLDHFLADPRGFVSGTAMSFAGLKKIEDRANVIAYLRTLSDSPAPLPEAAAAEREGTAAPGEEGGEAAPAAEGETEAAPATDAETAPADGAPQDAAPSDAAPNATDTPAVEQEEQEEQDATPDEAEAPAAGDGTAGTEPGAEQREPAPASPAQ